MQKLLKHATLQAVLSDDINKDITYDMKEVFCTYCHVKQCQLNKPLMNWTEMWLSLKICLEILLGMEAFLHFNDWRLQRKNDASSGKYQSTNTHVHYRNNFVNIFMYLYFVYKIWSSLFR